MVKDPQSVNKMQSEPQMPFDEIKPSNQKHRLHVTAVVTILTLVKRKKLRDKY
ncbi:hypothetical protein DPMN_002611 [Dreissena polymorpha]|uniref:Uncharacterized protein n=1 Tax=Dreissena polymorpha TaxID=45954 RepID=A0A9D4EQG3_DREPO|nr:hypothetical protein DPMN_162374 [Dreissena polymorpha]KAH3878712.1 hypothetical protein DPMN_002611 [Dreissena polymorpha]